MMKATILSSSPANPTFSRVRLSPIICLLLAFISFVVVLYSQGFSGTFITSYFGQRLQAFSTNDSFAKDNKKELELPFAVGKTQEGCNIFEGKWVWDKEKKPLYDEEDCRPYMHPQQPCQKYGRPDKDYQFWRWQPHDCDLPEFNATLMLEALRDKRMLFVGDSINRGQFMSMVCLLHRLVPEDQKVMETPFDHSLTVFRLKEYNASIEYYWAPFLLESNCDDPVHHGPSPGTTVRNGSIDKHGDFWKGADIMVFSTYLWWIHGNSNKMKILKGSFKDEVREIEELTTEDAYRMAMKTMLKWVQSNVDPMKTRVFFTSMSPTHEKSKEWGGEAGGNCYNETTPIDDRDYWGSDLRKNIMQATGEEFSKSQVPISILNITQLSAYRKDAHLKIYMMHPPNPEQLANPKKYADCMHWCLPGIQDTWNELLFAKLFYP